MPSSLVWSRIRRGLLLIQDSSVLSANHFVFTESFDPLSALVAVILRWLSLRFPMALNGFACSQDG